MAFKKLKYWFDEDLVQMLAEKINHLYPEFNSKRFQNSLSEKIKNKELKARVECFSDELFTEFNKDFILGINVLSQILGEENKNDTGMFKEYYWIMPIAKFVEKYGINNFDVSIKAIEEITKRNTSEYAIRPFLEKYTDKTLQQMLTWSTNKNFHVRRLASEGVRPRLPWAKKLQIFIDKPQLIIPILDNLKDDTSKYVQKSTANCLHDILKDNIEIGKQIVERWNTEDKTLQRVWILKHALRNLRKAEDKWALQILKQLMT